MQSKHFRKTPGKNGHRKIIALKERKSERKEERKKEKQATFLKYSVHITGDFSNCSKCFELASVNK